MTCWMRPLALLGTALAIFWGTAGCRRAAEEASLPPEDDLHAYSLAVAERARRLVPEEEALGIFHLGRVEQRFGLEDRALEIYEQALEIDPNLAEAHVQIGFILSQRNERHTEAIDAYRRALGADPTTPGVYTRLGLIHLHQNRLEEAERNFREEIRVGTPNEHTHYNLAQCLALAKRHEDAVVEFRKALAIHPGERMVHYGLSQSLQALGQSEGAKASLERFRELKRREDQAREDPALGSTNRDEQLRNTSEVWLDAGALLLAGLNREKDRTRGKELEREYLRAIEESIRFDPTAPTPREVLVGYHRLYGEVEKAAEACEDALNHGGSANLLRSAYELAGQLLEGVEAGNPRDEPRVALVYRLLEKVTGRLSDVPDAHREIARVILFFRKDREDLLPAARTHAQKAVELDPTARNYDILAYALFRAGDIPLARQTLEEAVRAHPEDEDLRGRLEKFLQQFP